MHPCKSFPLSLPIVPSRLLASGNHVVDCQIQVVMHIHDDMATLVSVQPSLASPVHHLKEGQPGMLYTANLTGGPCRVYFQILSTVRSVTFLLRTAIVLTLSELQGGSAGTLRHAPLDPRRNTSRLWIIDFAIQC